MNVDESTVLRGRYRLDRLLGRGGMAEVWAAWDERLRRPVAVKVLRAGALADPEVRERLRREGRAAASLDHPGVVRVFDADEVDGMPFLVMERLPGETLADRYRAGDVDDMWLMGVAGEVSAALASAHRAGVVHRDIKPGNIMITRSGEARLGDFGIATSLEVGGDATATGLVLGTPAYLAPERIEGAPATPASDVYALGVVLYEGFAGQRPFSGANPVAIAQAVLTETPAPLAELRPDLPSGLTGSIDRAMSKDPAWRHPSAEELMTALATGLVQAGMKVTGEIAAASGDNTVALDISDTTVIPVVAPPPPRRGSWLAGGALSGVGLSAWWRSPERDRRRLARGVAVGAAALALAAALAAIGLLGLSDSEPDPVRAEVPVTSIPPPTEPPQESKEDEDEGKDEKGEKGKGEQDDKGKEGNKGKD